MEGFTKSSKIDLNTYIETKKRNKEMLVQEKGEEAKVEQKKEKKGWALGEQLTKNERAKTNLSNLVGSTNKVFSYIMSTSPARSHNQQVLDQGLQNINPHTASQLLIAQRRFRQSHTLPHEMFGFAKAPGIYPKYKRVKDAPSDKGVANELNYVVRNFECFEPFQDLLKCVLKYEAQELCLVENKKFVHCIQEPVRELVLMSWGI